MPVPIRKMVCGGSQYYPQTCIQGVVDENGNGLGVDTEPTQGSSKLVTSGGVYEILNVLMNGAEISFSASPSTIYKNTSTSITLSASLPESTIPDTLAIYDGATLVKTVSKARTNSDTLILSLSSNSKTYTAKAEFGNFEIQGTATINARYPIYYGFGANISAITSKTPYAATTTAAHVYSGTSTANGQYFYILIPSDISALSTFVFGGAPFAVDTMTTETINGITYKVYKSSNSYNSGTTLNIDAK